MASIFAKERFVPQIDKASVALADIAREEVNWRRYSGRFRLPTVLDTRLGYSSRFLCWRVVPALTRPGNGLYYSPFPKV